MRMLILVTPSFNLAATANFIDPFRAANYLGGQVRFTWQFASVPGGEILASNAIPVITVPLAACQSTPFDVVVVSSSWTPEKYRSTILTVALNRWAANGLIIGAIDTGAFILAEAGLLAGRRATVHYEHIDAFKELYPDVQLTETLFTYDEKRFTCCGGVAAADMALHIVRETVGEAQANAAARYIFHHTVRGPGAQQGQIYVEPFGATTPSLVRQAVALMEQHLEQPLSIPEICQGIGISERQLSRLFAQFVGASPVAYYRDIRLDRARGLVTQTELPLSQVAAASGFGSQVHFSAAYKKRFGVGPRQDRIEGRIPFEFRAWPMHRSSD